MGITSAIVNSDWNNLLTGMTFTIVDTHGDGLFYCVLLNGMTSTIVATHGNYLYYCGLTCELPLLLWILMFLCSFVDTHVDDLYYCWCTWILLYY